jgi:hypothetical protein
VAHSQDFPGDSGALALAIAQLISDPHRRAVADEADRPAAHSDRVHVTAQTDLREQPAKDER